MKSGFFGIGIYNPMHECNLGTLFRSAYAFNADFIFTIGGRRYKQQASDTTASIRHIPYYYFQSYEDFNDHRPYGGRLVCIENVEESKQLAGFCHPLQAVYLLGNEAQGIPGKILENNITVKIPTSVCINVATAGSIVMYDRIAKVVNKL